MSLIGSLNAAVGGMDAQAAALANISDNVANSQTVGFKETDTAFEDMLRPPPRLPFAGRGGRATGVYQYGAGHNHAGQRPDSDCNIRKRLSSGATTDRRNHVQPAAVLYPCRRFHDQRQRIPGELFRLCVGRLARDQRNGDDFQHHDLVADPDQPGPLPSCADDRHHSLANLPSGRRRARRVTR